MHQPVGGDGHNAPDMRVAACLATLSGVPVKTVATGLGVEPALVRRWAEQFVTAGQRAVTNQPDPDDAARRDRFLTVLSHEMRTPLTVLKAAVPLVQAAETSELRPMLSAVQRAVDRLEGVAELFGQTAAASLGRLGTAPECLDIRELAATVIGGPVGGTSTLVWVDRGHAASMLTDLAETVQDRACVGVTVSPQEGWGQVTLTARPGLPAVTVAGLLEPFDIRDDASDITLGLYRARALAVANSGQIGANGGEQQTQFWLRLPQRC